MDGAHSRPVKTSGCRDNGQHDERGIRVSTPADALGLLDMISAAEHLDEGLIVTNDKSIEVYSNPLAKDLLSRSRKNLSDLQSDTGSDCQLRRQEFELLEGPPGLLEVNSTKRVLDDQSYCFYHLKRKEKLHAGEIPHLSKIIDNTVNSNIRSQRRRIEELTDLLIQSQTEQTGLYAQVRALEEAKSNLEFFGQIVARDMKECFSSLMIAARMLSEIKTLDPPEELDKLKRYSQHIIEKIQNLDQLAQDISSFSQSGVNGIEWSDFELEEVVVSALRGIHGLVRQRRAEIKLKNSSLLLGNLNLLSLALQDLFSYLIEESETDFPHIEVKSVRFASETLISLECVEEGAPEKQIPIRDALRKVSIAKKIIEAHGGKLWRKSETEAGMKRPNFIFTLSSWGKSDSTEN